MAYLLQVLGHLPTASENSLSFLFTSGRCRLRNLRTSTARSAATCVANALTNALSCPAQVNFKHLADVHPWNTQWVQDNVEDGVPSAMGKCPQQEQSWTRRPYFRGDQPSCHLAEGGFDGHVDLHHLQHTSGHYITLCQLLCAFFKRDNETVENYPA
jgi:hypothetical protein